MNIAIITANTQIWLQFVPGWYTPLLCALTVVMSLAMLLEHWNK